MRWSQAFIPTLRDDPADAEAVNHRLLVRGGFIRQLMAGRTRCCRWGCGSRTKVSDIIRQEMNAIGGQEFLLPMVHPAEPWRRSGRWDDVEGIWSRCVTAGAPTCCSPGLTRRSSPCSPPRCAPTATCPQTWYHLQTKFRDEARPKAGLLRVREFAMKDSYSFDIDAAGLDRRSTTHHAAYTRMFARLGLPVIPVRGQLAASMGGSESVEFMWRRPPARTTSSCAPPVTTPPTSSRPRRASRRRRPTRRRGRGVPNPGDPDHRRPGRRVRLRRRRPSDQDAGVHGRRRAHAGAAARRPRR